MTTETIATSVPLPWAMTLAARLAADGNPGRQIAEGLFELYGEPAKEALRGTMSIRAGPGAGARKLLGDVTIAPRHPVRLDVLGSAVVRVADTDEISDHWNRERVRSLLLYLVIHGPRSPGADRRGAVAAPRPRRRRSEPAGHAHLPQPGPRTRPAERRSRLLRPAGDRPLPWPAGHLQVDLDEFT